MSELNEFQKKMERELKGLVLSSGYDFLKKSVVIGKEENFIEGQVADIQFWIYDDGAGIAGAGEEHRLEKEDFDTLETLHEFFISTFRRLLDQKRNI